MSRKPQKKTSPAVIVLTALILIMVTATAYLIWLCVDIVNRPPEISISSDPVALPTAAQPMETVATETTVPETTAPQPEHVVSRATFLSTGDLVMHVQLIDKANTGSGYDFSPIFSHIKPYVSEADYALINLETTFGGSSLPYQGFPKFNCPDELAANAKDAGFDMFLMANNHSFDTGMDGFLRSLDVTRAAGLETIGTMKDATEPKYVIKEINGIRVGLFNYTYESSNGKGSQPSLNGNIMRGATWDNVNCYTYTDPTRMYTELEQYLAEMEAQDVDATIMYIHWGPGEYHINAAKGVTYAPDNFKKIAQKLCDLGIDVIVGGHPHVVEPMDLLESKVDPEHKTVVLYSMGNAVSNQRKGQLQSVKTAHTEDGVLYSVTFCRYSDGTVYLESTDVIPTWVNLADEYYILPLDPDTQDQWQTLYNLDTGGLMKAKDSYMRTMKIVGDGLNECQTWLASCQEKRDAYYLDLLINPEKYATQPGEETVPATAGETAPAA